MYKHNTIIHKLYVTQIKILTLFQKEKEKLAVQRGSRSVYVM